MAEIVKLKPIEVNRMEVRIKCLSPIITHRFDEKAKAMIRDKHAGKKTRKRDVRVPLEEAEAAAYKLSDGTYGIPAVAIKNAMVSAAHRDLGVPRTLIRRAMFIVADEQPKGELALVRLDHPDDPIVREDTVRVGMGSTDLRYRPEFRDWSLNLTIDYDTEWLEPETILAMLERAGFGIGLHEWRPERGGDFGRFEIDRESVKLLKAA